jgi:hypothetical protein
MVSVEQRPQHIVSKFPQLETEWKPHVKSFDRVSHVNDLGADQKLIEPFAEIRLLHPSTPEYQALT